MTNPKPLPRPTMIAALAVCALTLLFAPAPAHAAEARGTSGPAPVSSGGGGATPPALSHGVAPADLEALKTIHTHNQIDIKLGKMAKDRAGSDAVKSFASKMVADHSAQDKKIAIFLRKRGLRATALGPIKADVPPDHLSYKSKTGAAYDHAFATQMGDDYKKTIELVDRARNDTVDDGLRALLDQLLPVLRVLEATAQVLEERKERV